MAARSDAPVTWVFLEILIALAIAVAIVWWTIPRKPEERDDEGGSPPPGDER